MNVHKKVICLMSNNLLHILEYSFFNTCHPAEHYPWQHFAKSILQNQWHICEFSYFINRFFRIKHFHIQIYFLNILFTPTVCVNAASYWLKSPFLDSDIILFLYSILRKAKQFKQIVIRSDLYFLFEKIFLPQNFSHFIKNICWELQPLVLLTIYHSPACPFRRSKRELLFITSIQWMY